VRADGTREELPSKKMIVRHPGDQLAVLADLRGGKVSAASVAADYGVVLTPDGAAVDEVQTKERRAALRRPG
jgi:hypothetical protein